jgi:hypothetical protein
MAIRRLALAALLTVLAGCGGSSPTGPSSNTQSTSSLTARIDGTQWTAASGIFGNYQNNILSIGGSNTGSQVTLGFAVGRGDGGPLTTATYSFGPLEGHNATLYMGNPVQGWFGGPNFGSGTVTITALSSTGAAGTFTFTLVPTPGTGSSGNKAITQGLFNIRF